MVGGVRFGALDRPDVQPDVPVYVRRVDEDGYDEVTCEPSEPVDERIARRPEEIASLDRFHRERSGELPLPDSAPRLTSLHEEIIRYHGTHHPSRRADRLPEARGWLTGSASRCLAPGR
jgi:hypothetical protein